MVAVVVFIFYARETARLGEALVFQREIELALDHAKAAERSERVAREESEAPRTPGDLLARTRGDKMVIMPGPKSWIGTYRHVRVADANAHTLFGEAPAEDRETLASAATREAELTRPA